MSAPEATRELDEEVAGAKGEAPLLLLMLLLLLARPLTLGRGGGGGCIIWEEGEAED